MRPFGIAVPILLLVLLSLGCASTDWESRYLEKEAESRAMQEQLDSQNQLSAERQAAAETLRREMSAAQSQVEALAGEVDDLRKAPPVVKTVAAPAATDPGYEALQREYERLRREYDVRITEDGNLEITLDSNVTFASGSQALTGEGRRIIDSIARELKTAFDGYRVMVIGHTDSDPIRKSGFKDNLELGGERAFEVARYLAASHGIDPDRLVAASRGESSPIADNSSKDGKKKNRRVEIVVVIPKRELAQAGGR